MAFIPDFVPTHEQTILQGSIGVPSEALAAPNHRTVYGLPLEGEITVGATTTILLTISNFLTPYYINPYGDPAGSLGDTIHVTGIAFGNGDAVAHDFLTLDARNPQPEPHNANGWSAEEPLAFALGNDAFLIYRWSGSAYYDPALGSTAAFVVHVNPLTGAPTLVDSILIQSSGGYSPARGEILFVNPPSQWYVDNFVAYPEVTPDAGAFGYPVGPTGFGPRNTYPDPPLYQADIQAFNYFQVGLGVFGNASLVTWSVKLPDGQNDPRKGLYYFESGTYAEITFTAEAQAVTGGNLSSILGDKGDAEIGVPGSFCSYTWADDQVLTVDPATRVLSTAGAWTFVSGNAVLDAEGIMDYYPIRAWFSSQESRTGTYERTAVREVPYLTLQEVYDGEGFAVYYPVYADFQAAVIAYAGSEEAYLAEVNGEGKPAGYFVAFRDDVGTVDTAIDPVDNGFQGPVDRFLGKRKVGGLNEWFTLGGGNYTGSTTTVSRWSPIAPSRTAVIRVFPRDDGLNASSAPRVYPSPKAHRVVGDIP